MRYLSRFGFAYRIRWILPGIALFILFSTLAVAQKASSKGPKYDLQTETKLKGVVDELKYPPKGSEKEIAYFMVKSGSDTANVFVCPKAFLDDMGIAVAKGDEIALTGSKIKQDGADLFLVRELVKGNDTFVLRDDKGIPVW